MDALLASGALLAPTHRVASARRLPAARPRAVQAARSSALGSPSVRPASFSAEFIHGDYPRKDKTSDRIHTVGEFMTRKDTLRIVKPTTAIDIALQMLVEDGVSGFPVVDDNGRLVGVVSDYDLLALDSVAGKRMTDSILFPDVNSSWETFYELQKLLSKNHGKFVSNVMTDSPLVLRESSNLDDAARLLLETRHHRLPVVDAYGKLVGVITRGSVMAAAMQRKRDGETVA